jgi:hypothetical protein
VLLSTYEQNDRIAKIHIEDNAFVVYMFEDNVLKERRPLIGYSEQYAEDCAENWIIGVIK